MNCQSLCQGKKCVKMAEAKNYQLKKRENKLLMGAKSLYAVTFCVITLTLNVERKNKY